VLADGVIDTLYAFTDSETAITPNLVVINSENVPEVLSVTAVVKSNTDRLVNLLRAELEIERGHHYDRLHARTLEQIFIENRLYKVIENKKKADDIVRAVHKGLTPFVVDLDREITDDDVDTLLKIPIRRISLYDINRVKKEMREIRQRLNAIEKSLGDMTKETIGFLKGLLNKYGDNYPRLTEIESFDRTEKREVAKRDLQLRFDKKTGYVGHKVSGTLINNISPYDRVLIIRSDGTYTVSDAPEKLFAGRNMLHCGLVDTEQVFNLVYTDPFQYTFIKRFAIGAYILNKPYYQLAPEHCHVEGFTADSDAQIHLSYLPKPRLRKLEESFVIADYPIRNVKVSGIRLSTKELASCTVNTI